MPSPDQNLYYATAAGYYSYADKSGPYVWDGNNMILQTQERGPFPGYITGRYYPVIESNLATATAVPAANTLYAYPFRVPAVVAPQALLVRTVTGGASSAVKMAVWANNPTTARPTGVPILGSNTEQATTGNTTNQSVAVADVILSPGLVYWFGAVFKATLPAMLSITSPSLLTGMLGRAAMGTVQITALSVAFTQTEDIMALDLDETTWTDYIGAGVPLAYLQA